MARMVKIGFVVAFICVQLTTGSNSLSRDEIDEIRSFASKAYALQHGGPGGGGGERGRYPRPQYPVEPQGSFSHYVGRRVKPFGVLTNPLRILMRRPANYNNYRRPAPEPHPAEGILNYSFLAPFQLKNKKNQKPRRPPPPPVEEFDNNSYQPQHFTYSHPPVYMNGPPPPVSSFPNVNSIFPYENGQSPIQNHHQTKLAAVMAQQHLSNVKQAQSQVNSGTQDQNPKYEDVKFNVTTVLIKNGKEETKTEVFNPENKQEISITTPAPVNPNQNQVDGSLQGHWKTPVAYEVAHFIPPPPPPPHPMFRNPHSIPFGSSPPYTAGYHHVQPQFPVPMRILYHGQGFPPSGPNGFLNTPPPPPFHPEYVRFETFVTSPSPVAPTTESSKSTVPTLQPETDSSTTPIPIIPTASTIVFQSAGNAEQVSLSSSGVGSSYNNRPLTLTPEEQKNVFTAAADSSYVEVAPLVFSSQSSSPLSSSRTTQSPNYETIQRPDSKYNNTSITVSVYSDEQPVTKATTSSGEDRKSVRVEEGVTSTVTRVLASGKRVRFRKVKKSSKENKSGEST